MQKLNQGTIPLDKSQKGFSAIFIIIAVIVLGLGVGGFLYVKNQNSEKDIPDVSITNIEDETVANGTPSNAVKATSEQITSEIVAEDAAMKMEEEASEFSNADIEELQGVANESNL